MSHDLDPFFELLPFYVNNTLDEEESLFIKNYLAKNPEYQAEYEFEKSLRVAIKKTTAKSNAKLGLKRLHKEIKAQQSVKNHSAPPLWRDFWINWGLTPAITFASLLLIAQSFIIFELWTKNPNLQLRTELQFLSSNPTKTTVTLELSIHSTATIQQVGALLAKVKGTIIQGPSEKGELSILISASQLEKFREILLTSPIVTKVSTPIEKAN